MCPEGTIQDEVRTNALTPGAYDFEEKKKHNDGVGYWTLECRGIIDAVVDEIAFFLPRTRFQIAVAELRNRRALTGLPTVARKPSPILTRENR